MITKVAMEALSPTMEEGRVVQWLKHEGDAVRAGEVLAEVETDKANMDFNIEDDGVLLKLLVQEGETVKLGAPVAILGSAGEDVTALIAEARRGGGATPAPAPAAKTAAADAITATPAARPAAAAAAAPPAKPAAAKPVVAKPASNGGRVLASPLAKSLAIELGIDLRQVQGSGPGGRVVERDVRAQADGQPTQASFDETADTAVHSDTEPTRALAVRPARQLPLGDGEDYTDVPASNMRKRIAARLTEAKRDVPHFYLMRKLDAAPLLAFRARLNELLGDRGKVSVNDLVTFAGNPNIPGEQKNIVVVGADPDRDRVDQLRLGRGVARVHRVGARQDVPDEQRFRRGRAVVEREHRHRARRADQVDDVVV